MHSIVASLILIFPFSIFANAQNISLVNPSAVKRCIEGRWGESAPGLASPLNPGLFWDVTFLSTSGMIFVERSDKAIKGAFAYMAGSDGQFKGYLMFNPGPQQTVENNVTLTQTDDCRTMSLAGEPWWFRRL